MRSVILSTALVILLAPAPSPAQEFSLFGVKMGMTREEIGQIWRLTEAGEYTIEGSAIFNIQPEFDHRDRLYKLSFSSPIGEEYPGHLLQSALQRLVKELWGSDPAVSVSTRSSRGIMETTVTSQALTEEYITHIKLQYSTLFQP
ncbi:MAG: hypothetical protein JSV26_09710 [bacterium]|nr:MAG: hypothetical protein JSV26_09710 [bacterium]